MKNIFGTYNIKSGQSVYLEKYLNINFIEYIKVDKCTFIFL